MLYIYGYFILYMYNVVLRICHRAYTFGYICVSIPFLNHFSSPPQHYSLFSLILNLNGKRSLEKQYRLNIILSCVLPALQCRHSHTSAHKIEAPLPIPRRAYCIDARIILRGHIHIHISPPSFTYAYNVKTKNF